MIQRENTEYCSYKAAWSILQVLSEGRTSYKEKLKLWLYAICAANRVHL